MTFYRKSLLASRTRLRQQYLIINQNSTSKTFSARLNFAAEPCRYFFVAISRLSVLDAHLFSTMIAAILAA